MKVLMTLLLLVLGVNAASLDDLTYTTADGKVTITDCDEAATGELVIPQTIRENPVTSIRNFAFYKCSRLTSITIPDSVTSVGGYAFSRCTSLTNIAFQGAAPTVGREAFTGVANGAIAIVTIEALSSFGEVDNHWNSLPIQVRDGTTNPAPLPEIRTAIEFSFDGMDGVSYRIESSTDLINWEMIETAIIGEGSRIDRFYSTRNQPNRYFRVKTN